MKTGVESTANAGRDKVVVSAMMTARLGFVLALLLGLGFLSGLIQPGGALMFHMLAGILLLVGILVAFVRSLRRGGVTLLGLGLASGLAGSSLMVGGKVHWTLHVLLMLAAIALAEINVSKLKKAG